MEKNDKFAPLVDLQKNSTMKILVNEELRTVYYDDNGESIVKDQLSVEMKECNSVISLQKWDFKLSIGDTSSTIMISEYKNAFLAEGFENLYYVSSENQVQWIAKDTLFSEAAKRIIDNIMNAASNDGYDIKPHNCRENILKASVLAMKTFVGQKPNMRIPYLLDIDLGKTPIGLNYNRIPMFYEVNDQIFQIIIDAISNSIKTHFQIRETNTSLSFYSYSGLLSKIALK